MFRRTFAWAVVAAISIAVLSDPRPTVARGHQTDAVQPTSTIEQTLTVDQTLTVEQTGSVVAASSVMPGADVLEAPHLGAPAAAATADSPEAAGPVGAAANAAAEVPAAAPAEPAPPAVAAPTEQPAPRPVQAALVAPVVAPAAPAAPVAIAPPPPPPPACPATWFCYPRVGIAGPIVPYGDCSAATDVGTAIRSITCVSPTYLAGHAYTQMGLLTGWRAGDIVFAYGTRYIVTGGFTQGSCVAPAHALAPLSMQTSLSTTDCGPVLVVQGRPG